MGLAPEPTNKRDSLPAFFYRLAPRAQKVYLQSEATDRIELTPSVAAHALVKALLRALEAGELRLINRNTQLLAFELCRLLRVAPVEVEVRGVRPHNTRGELHGIFFPGRRQIVLWMRTAQRHDVVKPKTFFRTLAHELGHYFDYSVLKLGDSYHTRGFFKRESFLVRMLYPTGNGSHEG